VLRTGREIQKENRRHDHRRDRDRLAAGTWDKHRDAGRRVARRPAKALDATGTRRDHRRRQDLDRQDRHGDRAGIVTHG
jgi:hypothetical protein